MSRFPPTLKRAFEIKALLPSLQRTLEILFFRNVCLSQIEYICLQTPPPFLMPSYKAYSLHLLLLNLK